MYAEEVIAGCQRQEDLTGHTWTHADIVYSSQTKKYDDE